MTDAGVPSLPLVAGVEHFSTTVPDLAQAVRFFVDVLGGREVRRLTFAAAPGSAEMELKFNAHPAAEAQLATLDLAGTTIELFEYDAPDLSTVMPRNCDAGGHHIGFRVASVAAAVAALVDVPGVRVLGEPTYGPLASGGRRGWVYFLTPWGLQLELAEETTTPEPGHFT
jgi:catechol 2,3-dioxygenase-like lactoylglutathione lyase family enzyme